MIGIYAIRNKANRKVYIGQSKNVQKRLKRHLDDLERGKHHSKKLQEDFTQYGAEQFTLEVIELCKRDQLLQKAMEWVNKFDSLNNGYNVQDPGKRSSWLFQDAEPVGLTVWGEFTRIVREVSFSLIHDFEDWVKNNRDFVRIILKGILISSLAMIALIIGILILRFWGIVVILYILFLMGSGIAIGIIHDQSKAKKS